MPKTPDQSLSQLPMVTAKATFTATRITPTNPKTKVTITPTTTACTILDNMITPFYNYIISLSKRTLH